jgi:sulfite reductase beta subunit-like hemoprotein
MLMTIDYQKLRLDGLYQQDKAGHLMLRVKVPAGVLSSTQAEAICDLSERYSNGILHLTCRGSIEFHWLKYDMLADIFRQLAAVGLSSRGACGGAVRGISCSTTFTHDFPLVQNVARKLNRHFMGNPYFEGLPKKFKIGVDSGYDQSRHLIQDVGLVFVGSQDDQPCFDIWCAGGLGREPQAAFLLEQGIPESGLIPLIEAAVQVYRDNTPPPKRLKYLINQVGETEFRKLLHMDRQQRPQPQVQSTLDGPTVASGGEIINVPIFAGELQAAALLHLALIARDTATGFLAVTADQNIALPLLAGQDCSEIRKQLEAQGFFNNAQTKVCFRICPGNHECRMGLVATRDIARDLIAGMGENGSNLKWAVSGCSNSCSQPQLADYGIISRRLVSEEDGTRSPRFDMVHRNDAKSLGQIILENLTLAEVHKFTDGLN